MEGEGIQLYSFSSTSSLSQVSAASGSVVSTANAESRSAEQQRNEKQQEEIRTTLKDIFQLANYYIVFQGVIFTAIFSNPSSPVKCQYRWFPISLSVVAGFLNLSILGYWIWMYSQLRYEREKNLTGVGNRPIPPYLKHRRDRRRIFLMSCLVVLVLFLGVLLFGSWEMLCSESEYSQRYNFKNCFELCNNYGRCTLICLQTSP